MFYKNFKYFIEKYHDVVDLVEQKFMLIAIKIYLAVKIFQLHPASNWGCEMEILVFHTKTILVMIIWPIALECIQRCEADTYLNSQRFSLLTKKQRTHKKEIHMHDCSPALAAAQTGGKDTEKRKLKCFIVTSP